MRNRALKFFSSFTYSSIMICLKIACSTCRLLENSNIEKGFALVLILIFLLCL